jgi:hypothetical protein
MRQAMNRRPLGVISLPPLLDCLEGVAPDSQEYSAVLLYIVRPQRNPSGNYVRHPVREHVIELIIKKVRAGHIEPKKATLALIDSLADGFSTAAVANALGLIGTDAKAALPALRRLKTHSDQAIRDAANEAIERISVNN